MRIIFLMAGIAVARRLTMFVIGGMAVCAFVFGVLAEQWEVGELVIKIRLVETHDVGITALVVRVAVCTAVLADTLELAMKARRTIDICGDIFVAVEAERTLSAAFESLVAGFTLTFVLGMTLDDLARHDQRFDLGVSSLGNDE